MAISSPIEWTEATWNPVTGCTKISPGCAHCYAERMAKRLQAIRQPNYTNGFELSLHERMLDVPLSWRRPRRVFVNSMSDLLHEDVPLAFIQRVVDVMARAGWHTFQVLTKRSSRLLELDGLIAWPANVWVGVSIENARFLQRIDDLRRTHVRLKFLSCEPLLGSLRDIDLAGIDWVIVGGESGPRARPMKARWVREIRDQCVESHVPFFFKQWGGVFKSRTGRELDGRMWDELPVPPSDPARAGAATRRPLNCIPLEKLP